MYNIVAFDDRDRILNGAAGRIAPARTTCKGPQLLHLRKIASLSNRPAVML